jgi:type VI secretion system secreted protein VgrG
MPQHTQKGRPLSVQTPLGEDKLLLIGFTGQEGLSQLFRFHLETLAEAGTEVPFQDLLGKKVTLEVELPDQSKRFYNGIASRVVEGAQTGGFTEYSIEIVPQFWLLTRRVQSRIFQHLPVSDILRSVFEGLAVKFDLRGKYHPREYCVQYRESDFAFASRLMEEEGIYYYFDHKKDEHTMVVADHPEGHLPVPGAFDAIYETVEGGVRHEDRVITWLKTQELRSGKSTLWDHSFQLPHKHLEADKNTMESVAAGTIEHKLSVADNSKLEVFDYPGFYAKRFDGVGGGGGDTSANLQKIFDDNKRMAEVRMQEETAAAVVIHGSSHCRQFTSGHKFALARHFNADGQYVLTTVYHQGAMDSYRSDGVSFSYSNTFTCIPVAMPFRPVRVTPRALVRGTQSAVVVGPAGEEIFTDKYGRVKVQFHWDREGQNNADSSCWLRVATHWSGKQWGMIHTPRIGQEVIVDFLEGDPDQPIVVGSVYNPDQMPPYELPANKTQSGIKTRSSPGGGPSNFNEIRFEDKKGSEQLYIHAERNEDTVVEANETLTVGHDREKKIGHDETTLVKNNRTETVLGDESITIAKRRTETVGMNESVTIGASRTHTVAANESLTVGVNRNKTVAVNETSSIGVARTASIGGSDSLTVGGTEAMNVGGVVSINAGGAIAINAGGAITINAGGTVIINAPAIMLNGRLVVPIAPVPIV